jgi:hypothetical protein
MTVAIKMLHDYATERNAGSGQAQKALNREAVIAFKGSIRTAFVVVSSIFVVGPRRSVRGA